MIDTRGSPHLTVFIYAPDQAGEINLRLLMKLYQLTVTEASVAIMLTQGHTLDEVATGMNMARNTARAHLRAIFSKTGVTQQSMLVSLVLKSLASLP
jgi:DNA-binding CsgD family transcriptional regulator